MGNDPDWSDGGPDGRYLDYWQNYSFGDLSATAQTRKVVLERLIPRRKIAPRCSLSDRFLVVRGDLRAYRIHLGSGNFLMAPNDQYLCIVAGRGAIAADNQESRFRGDRSNVAGVHKGKLICLDEKARFLVWELKDRHLRPTRCFG